MYFEYNKVTPGILAEDFTDLLTVLSLEDTQLESRESLKEEFWGAEYTLGYQSIANTLLLNNESKGINK